MKNISLWLRWSWRDLRERWLQVAAIALIIALGTGVYSGLGSSKPWRLNAYDKSYAQLHMYDLRVELTEGSYVSRADLLAAVRGIAHADWIEAAEARLIAPTLVSVPNGEETILVPGRLMGVDTSAGGPHVNGIHLMQGRALNEADAGQNRAVLEYAFARHYDLPPSGTLQLSGGTALDYVGQGMTPEYFMVIADEIGFKDEANFAVVMVPLETAQAITGHEGQVNDLVVLLKPGADRDTVRTELEQAITGGFAQVGFSIMAKEDDPAYQVLYGDMDSDEQIFLLIAYLFLAGAAFGTFNLASRIVEAQRRQIGIGMALGVPRPLIAVRPLLVGAQIALLGVIFGLSIGLGLSRLFGMAMKDIMPMPVFEMPFQAGIFARAAALGIILPFVATLYPVWRAVRVQPIDAIKTGYLVAKGGGLAPLLARVPVPGRSFTQMPIRNLLRAPRRTMLTLLGVAMAITVLIANLGMLDSFLVTINAGEQEFLQNSPERMIVALDFFYTLNSDQVRAIQNSPALAAAEPGIQVGGEMRHGDTSFDVSIELIDLNSPLWRPTLVKGEYPSAAHPGILIAEKAADDLGVQPGDTITLKHPRREGLFEYRMVESQIVVAGIHKNPLRSMTYLSIEQARLMGLEGLANVIHVNPAEGVSQDEAQAALFQMPGVASVREVAAFTSMLKEMMSLLIAFMSIVVAVVLVLAFLIAFNSTSINVDERAREIATLFAFGLPVRTVTRMAVVENLVIGVLGTALGLVLGWITLVWMMNGRVETMLPDVHLTITLQPLSLVLAAILGVVVVGLTPLLSVRKLARMNLPSTLRVME